MRGYTTFSGENYELAHANALDWLETLKNESIDLFITDPPYSSGASINKSRRMKATSSQYISTRYRKKLAALYADFEGNHMDAHSYRAFTREWASLAFEKTKQGGALFCFIDWSNLINVIDAIQLGFWTYRGILVWDKVNARPQMHMPRRQAEFIVYATKGAPSKQFQIIPGVITGANVSGKQRLHQTQKPVPVMRQLCNYAPAGALICDPFAGAASTGVAALLNSQRFIGCEYSAEYASRSAARLHDTEQELAAQAEQKPLEGLD